jgi:TIR domain
VLQIDTPTRNECRRYRELRIVDPVQITIVAPDLAQAPAAERLFDRLRSSLVALAASPKPRTSLCGRSRDLRCMARSEPSCRSVLVVLTGSTRISSRTESLMLDWTATRPVNSSVLPILPAGASPTTVLPSPLHRLTTLFDHGAIEQLAPDVMRTAGIAGREHRLFISYRRDDVQELAEDLHDAFTHRGFHVFLDRFRGIAGTPFPQQLQRELADKGVVLVIESPLIARSRWTLREVSFARALRLGLVALATPGAPQFAAISPADRIQPAPGDWTASSPRPRLTPAALQDIVEAIRARYAQHALYRQLYLENLLHRALGRHRLNATVSGGGAFSVTGGAQYVVQLSPRLPELREIRNASTKAGASGACAVVVGAARLLAPDDAADLQWMAAEVKVELRRESAMQRLARSVASGKVPP